MDKEPITQNGLKKLKDAGLRGIGVSIDGPEDAHDLLRARQGSWKAGMKAIERAASHGLIVTSNTQINQLTKDRLHETAHFLKEAGVRVWRCQITVPMGRAADRPEWLLQPWEMLEVIDDLAEIKTQSLLDAHEQIKAGTDQTIINYLVQQNNLDTVYIPEAYNLQDLFIYVGFC